MTKLLLATAFALLITAPSHAQDVVQLPDGHTALNISATESVDVEQDLLIASLRIQSEGKDSKAVQKEINDAMAQAVALAKKSTSLKIETGQYYVSPDYRYIETPTDTNERVLDKWRGSQTLMIKSENAEDVLNITGQIQDMGFMMNSLDYQLSPKKYDEVRDSLMETTIKALNDRAKRVATALGKTSVDIVEINIDSNNYSPRPVYARAAKVEMMSMSADAMPAPTAESGETSVSMTINARAIIK